MIVREALAKALYIALMSDADCIISADETTLSLRYDNAIECHTIAERVIALLPETQKPADR